MRLENMNFFEKVETTEEPTDVPNRKDLVIGIEEKSTGNLSVGAGFSSIDSLVGFVELSQGNFDLFKPPTFSGGGQKFRLRAQLGTRRQDYVLSFVEPWFFGKKLSFGVDLFHRELDFVSDIYSERRTGATLSLSKALGSDFLIGTVSYTLEEVGIIDVDRTQASPTIIAEEGIRSSSKAGLSIAYDTRNSNFLPTAGQRTELSTKYAGGILGGQTDVYGFELSSAHYFKGFAEGHVIEVVGSVGVVDSHDNSRVPLFERYFLGGANTLRGYQFRQVGPRDALNEPTGGNTFWMGSVEYSIPIISRLRLATFYDIGMVYQDAFSFSEGGNNTGFYNDNVGVGFRLNLPIGPLRLDYGIPITSDPANGGSGRFQFGAGYTRQF
jgi:outer membrane protein insertion porin family